MFPHSDLSRPPLASTARHLVCRSARRASAGVDSACRIRREVSSSGGRKLRTLWAPLISSCISGRNPENSTNPRH